MAVERPEALAGAFRVTTRSVPLVSAPATVQLAGADPTRVALFLILPQAWGAWVWPGSTMPSTGGLPIPPTGYLEFYFAQVGGLVGMEWYGADRMIPPSGVVSVIEVAYRPRSE
jgi:hypothetical protein